MQIHILRAVIEDAREAHRYAIVWSGMPLGGHTALETGEETSSPPDVECILCGHINEADYMLAEEGAN